MFLPVAVTSNFDLIQSYMYLLWIVGASPEHAALARAAASGSLPYGGLPPGFPGGPHAGLNIATSAAGEMPAQMMAALAAAQQGAGQDISQRELLAMQQVSELNADCDSRFVLDYSF